MDWPGTTKSRQRAEKALRAEIDDLKNEQDEKVKKVEMDLKKNLINLVKTEAAASTGKVLAHLNRYLQDQITKIQNNMVQNRVDVEGQLKTTQQLGQTQLDRAVKDLTSTIKREVKHRLDDLKSSLENTKRDDDEKKEREREKLKGEILADIARRQITAFTLADPGAGALLVGTPPPAAANVLPAGSDPAAATPGRPLTLPLPPASPPSTATPAPAPERQLRSHALSAPPPAKQDTGSDPDPSTLPATSKRGRPPGSNSENTKNSKKAKRS